MRVLSIAVAAILATSLSLSEAGAEKTIVGYCDPLSVAPGETIRFMVSTYEPGAYRAEIVRLICGDTDAEGAGFKEEEIKSAVSGEYPGRRQTNQTGSYGIVPASTALGTVRSFTVQAMVYPTTPQKGRQMILGTWSEDDGEGFGLLIDEGGSLGLILGDGKGRVEVVNTGTPLASRRWCLVAATYDANTGQVTLRQEQLPVSAGIDATAPSVQVRREASRGLVASGPRPVLFAGAFGPPAGGRRFVGMLYNGKIDSPRLADRPLIPSEENALLASKVPASLADAVVGFWDFSEDISSDRITDLSSNALHGTTVNLPLRGVMGYNWTGREHDWKHAPQEYGAIHFHDDDVYDAGWEADFELVIPETMRSGVYAARLRLGEKDDYIPFFVRPPRGEATAAVAYLASTATYIAYANYRLGGERTQFLRDHPEIGRGLYLRHSDGSGVHYSSRLRPILNMKPKGIMWSFNADTNITDWLEKMGFRYDVITDEDLHREGLELLRPYRAVLTGTHPEYYSTAMLDAVDAYQRGGGRLVYLGGNGFYWRIAFHPEKPGVIEVRRAEGGTRAWMAASGEYYHAFNGEYGGLWRRLGRPPNLVCGVGFVAMGFDRSSYYRLKAASRDPRAAFIFEGVDGEIIGDYGSRGGGAAGEEIDRFDRSLGAPPHALVLATSEKHSASTLRSPEELYSMLGFGRTDPAVRADLVFYECPKGGAVFSTGSIAWAGSLAHNDYDNDISRVTENVLRRFVDPEPFNVP